MFETHSCRPSTGDRARASPAGERSRWRSGTGASAVLIFPAPVVSSLSSHRTLQGGWEWKLSPRDAAVLGWRRTPGAPMLREDGVRLVGRPAGPRADDARRYHPLDRWARGTNRHGRAPISAFRGS